MGDQKEKRFPSSASESGQNRASCLTSLSLACAFFGLIGSVIFDYMLLGKATHEEVLRHEAGLVLAFFGLVINLVLLVGFMLGFAGLFLARSAKTKLSSEKRLTVIAAIMCAALLTANIIVIAVYSQLPKT